MEKKSALAATLKLMEVGQTREWPIERLLSVRSACHNYGLALRRKFKCIAEGEVVRVTREK